MKISGTVRDAGNRAPVDGAHVRLAVGNREIAETYTNQNGQFSLEERAGPFAEVGAMLKVRADKPGYREVEAEAAVGRSDLAFELELGSTDDERIEPGPSIWERIAAWLNGVPRWAWAAAAAVVLLLAAVPWLKEYMDSIRVPTCNVEAYTELRASPREVQFERAVQCLEIATANRDPNAIALVARHLLVPAAGASHAGAALQLAKLYDPRSLTADRAGQLTPDPVIAAERYRDARSLGEPSAQAELAAMLQELEQRGETDRSARISLDSLRRRGLTAEPPAP